MKAIKMRIQKSSQWIAILLATIVAIITTAVVANATQTITTPNAVKITYNLATGGNSAPITPVANTSVLVMGCCTTLNFEGVGHVSLQHFSSAVPFIEWVGLESPSTSPSTITSGISASAGVHIVWIDFAHVVDIQVNSADTIRIHNGSSGGLAGPKAGNVTLVW